MKKMFLFLLAGILLLFSGCDFLEGPAGADGISIPGGTIDITVQTLTPSSTAVVVFDPDEKILDGDETVITIPLVSYTNGDTARFITSWRAPEVVPGDYYVYYWIDFDGDGVIDTLADDSGKEENTLSIFNDSTSALSFDPAGAVTTIISDNLLFPNYTVWDNFAPQLNLAISTGW